MAAAALDLGIFSDQLAAAGVMARRLSLRVQTEAACALAVSRNAVIGDEFRCRHCHVQKLNVGLVLYKVRIRGPVAAI